MRLRLPRRPPASAQTPAEFAEALSAARFATRVNGKALSQTTAAARLQVDRGTIRRWETARQVPNDHEALKLAALYGDCTPGRPDTSWIPRQAARLRRTGGRRESGRPRRAAALAVASTAALASGAAAWALVFSSADSPTRESPSAGAGPPARSTCRVGRATAEIADPAVIGLGRARTAAERALIQLRRGHRGRALGQLQIGQRHAYPDTLRPPALDKAEPEFQRALRDLAAVLAAGAGDDLHKRAEELRQAVGRLDCAAGGYVGTQRLHQGAVPSGPEVPVTVPSRDPDELYRTDPTQDHQVYSRPSADSRPLRVIRAAEPVRLECWTAGKPIRGPSLPDGSPPASSGLWYRLPRGGYLPDMWVFTGDIHPVTAACDPRPRSYEFWYSVEQIPSGELRVPTFHETERDPAATVVRGGPSTQAVELYRPSTSDRIDIICFTVGSEETWAYTGRRRKDFEISTNLWWLLRTGGYVHDGHLRTDELIEHGQGAIPACQPDDAANVTYARG